jgi:hypothetical protein
MPKTSIELPKGARGFECGSSHLRYHATQCMRATVTQISTFKVRFALCETPNRFSCLCVSHNPHVRCTTAQPFRNRDDYSQVVKTASSSLFNDFETQSEQKKSFESKKVESVA